MLDPLRWKSLTPRYCENRPHRMLALDGGGLRGLITLGMLEKIEGMLPEREVEEGGQKTRVKLKLCDYFDYIGGTSTGAIIAAGLAIGMTTADLIKFYRDFGREMFDHSAIWERYKYSYKADPLVEKLKAVFGAETTLGSEKLQCLLMTVTKNVTTDSPWPVSSNPDAKYNDSDRVDNNLKMLLWKLVRASTAAPTFFPAEVMTWDPEYPSKAAVFVDGGVTPYNNPAFQLYRMATEPAYRLNWKKGEKELLLISLGTGAAEALGATAAAPNKNIVSTATGLPGELMYAMQVDQDINCRSIGRCTYGAPLDREMMDLVPRRLEGRMTLDECYAAPKIPLSEDLGRAFLYARYNADLSRKGLDTLGFPDVDPDNIQRMDRPDNIEILLKIGQAAAKQVDTLHFGSFL